MELSLVSMLPPLPRGSTIFRVALAARCPFCLLAHGSNQVLSFTPVKGPPCALNHTIASSLALRPRVKRERLDVGKGRILHWMVIASTGRARTFTREQVFLARNLVTACI